LPYWLGEAAEVVVAAVEGAAVAGPAVAAAVSAVGVLVPHQADLRWARELAQEVAAPWPRRDRVLDPAPVIELAAAPTLAAAVESKPVAQDPVSQPGLAKANSKTFSMLADPVQGVPKGDQALAKVRLWAPV
jgi:hypothetical protein